MYELPAFLSFDERANWDHVSVTSRRKLRDVARVRAPALSIKSSARVTYLSEVVTRKNTCILVVRAIVLARLRHCGRWSRGIRRVSGLVTFQATERHFAMGTFCFCCLVRTSNLSVFVLPDSHDGQSGLDLNGFMAFNFLCVGNCCRAPGEWFDDILSRSIGPAVVVPSTFDIYGRHLILLSLIPY